jgi:hypothetical protein
VSNSEVGNTREGNILKNIQKFNDECNKKIVDIPGC